MRTRAIILASGGLDSSTLFHWLLKRDVEPIPLFVDYGQHSATTERNALISILPDEYSTKVREVDISSLYRGLDSGMIHEFDLWNDSISDDDLYVPYRNQLLLTIGAAYAQISGVKDVYSAFIESNLALGADCTTEFLDEITKLTKRFGGVEFHFPFQFMSKFEVAQLGVELEIPIWETYSCLARAEVACGACPNCIDRNQAFKKLSEVPK